ncbi:response regulator [Geovibrio thiophilus]|uniref:Response regulator n=1 Tax=Geovibrio thiophilus TaxID=139438 RepID=A0A410K1Q7_9BACT|nr:response regulator [Geovibrio thiophilus]QAR34178.1 response regulator [Geovibrio thiophilus]
MYEVSDLLEEMNERKPLVLIVDDVPKNIQLLSLVLSRKNYEIAFAVSGEQALEMLESISPELILLDIVMPGMDGFEVCERVRSNPVTEGIPIIFLTGRASAEDIKKGFQTGAVDYISKPFNSEELLARVRTHIELKRNQDMKDSLISLLQKTVARFRYIADLVPDAPSVSGTDEIASVIEKFVRDKI